MKWPCAALLATSFFIVLLMSGLHVLMIWEFVWWPCYVESTPSSQHVLLAGMLCHLGGLGHAWSDMLSVQSDRHNSTKTWCVLSKVVYWGCLCVTSLEHWFSNPKFSLVLLPHPGWLLSTCFSEKTQAKAWESWSSLMPN